MKSSIGKQLSFEEVTKLSDGTRIWVETNFPSRNILLGIKQDKCITNLAGQPVWAIAEDFKVLCTAFEWKNANKIEIIVKSKITGRVVTGEYTPIELIDKYEDEIVDELTSCDCEPVGETNVVECNCCEEWENYDFIVDGIIKS